MKFSAQEEYGLRCLVVLTREGEGASVTIPQISAQEGLTVSHVAKLMAILRTAGLVTATRGQSGGYQLARKPSELYLNEILEPLGGRLFDDGFCDRFKGHMDECVHKTDCTLRPLWSNLQHVVDSVVSRYTLEDLLEGRLPEAPLKVAPRRS